MDSTWIKVCHNRRIAQHKVLGEGAARGKTSVDWFFGNRRCIWSSITQENCGGIILTPGNTDECTPVSKFLQQLPRKIFGTQLITKLKRNIKQRLMPLNDRLVLRFRSIIDQLKNNFCANRIRAIALWSIALSTSWLD